MNKPRIRLHFNISGIDNYNYQGLKDKGPRFWWANKYSTFALEFIPYCEIQYF